jgi:hypothetical protein
MDVQQVPLIELELNTLKAPENDSDREDGGKRGLKRDRADEPSEEQSSNGQRRTNTEKCTFSECGGARASREESSRRTRRHDADNDAPPPKRPRYNGGIAGTSHRTASPTADATTSAGKPQYAKKTATQAAHKGGRGLEVGNFTSLSASPGRAKPSLDQLPGVSKPLRRSSRIAEKEQRRNTPFENTLQGRREYGGRRTDSHS